MNGRGLLLAAAALLVVAGSAFAWGGQGRPGQMQRFSEDRQWERRGPGGVAAFRGDLPEAMQEKVLEMRKVQHEMALALMEKDVDKAKVTALHKKRMVLRNEISRWRFEQGLNRAAGEKNPIMRGGMWRQDRPENRRNGGWEERREWRNDREGSRENRQDFRRQNWRQNRSSQPNV